MNDPAGSVNARIRRVAVEDISASAVVALPFAAYLVALNLSVRPSAMEWDAADPILKILPAAITLWAVPAMAAIAALFWTAGARPSKASVRRATTFALAGAITSVVLLCALRLSIGAEWPSFIPPEESSAPGPLLNMTAGLAEEILFRCLVLPLLFIAFRRKLRPILALLAASALTGLLFAGLHELGPAAFAWPYLVTRIVIPGFAMSLVWGLMHPAFIVVAHCSAHVLIPLLFTTTG